MGKIDTRDTFEILAELRTRYDERTRYARYRMGARA